MGHHAQQPREPYPPGGQLGDHLEEGHHDDPVDEVEDEDAAVKARPARSTLLRWSGVRVMMERSTTMRMARPQGLMALTAASVTIFPTSRGGAPRTRPGWWWARG